MQKEFCNEEEGCIEITDSRAQEIKQAVREYQRKGGIVKKEKWNSLGNFLSDQGFKRQEIAFGAKIYSNRTTWRFVDM